MELSLEDRIELHELPGRYGDAIDDRNWDELRKLFTDDAVFIVAGLGVEMRGIEEIIRFMEEEAPHPAAHLMTNIHIEADDQAVRLFTRAILPVAEDPAARLSKIVHGSYYDEVVKTAAGWRIRHRLFTTKRTGKREAKVDRRPR